MTREVLDKKIQESFDEILALGGMIEQAILNSVRALKQRNQEAAQAIYDADQEINNKRFDIENKAMVAIATQQPLARDLRILASVIDVAGELERMGDYAKGIARICLLMKDQTPIKPITAITDLPRMAELATNMLHRALEAFVVADAAVAIQIPKEDDQVDDLYNQINRVLITYMISDPSTIDRANYLTWAAHNLERMADRVTNICERTIYIATGEMKELE